MCVSTRQPKAYKIAWLGEEPSRCQPSKPMRPKFSLYRSANLLALFAAVLLSACGGGGDDEAAPVAYASSLRGMEDQPIEATLRASHIDGKPLTYRIVRQPIHGQAIVDAGIGRVVYTPAPDYAGADTFWFVAETARGTISAPVSVQIIVEPVNDPPTIEVAAQALNSAYSYRTSVPVTIADVDSTPISTEVTVLPADVVRVSLSDDRTAIEVEPLRRGSATITIQADDGERRVEASLTFHVTDVRREHLFTVARPEAEAITISNRGATETVFRLEHNNFPSFATLEEVAAFVSSMPAMYADETFASKLWRFVRDSVIHEYPLSQEQWIYDPLVTLNSLGWGLCSNVASLYARIARAAGHESRVWGLGGHVVPEIRVGDDWQMYDPDLGVFYYDRQGRIASVETLGNDPSIVSAPEAPIHSLASYPEPYNDFVRDIYATRDDNAVETWYDGPDVPLQGTVVLPAGAALTYPGHWSGQPTGYDAGQSFPITHFRHAVIDLPAAFRGQFGMPWMLRAIEGQGRIRIEGREFAIESDELRDWLAAPRRIVRELEVIEATSALRLVFYVNAARFVMTPETRVAVTGLDVWALDVTTLELDPEFRVQPEAQAVTPKPRSRLEI